MPRINIQVPYAEKDQAKQLGAKWDREKKVWFIPEGIDTAAFKQWMPDIPEANIRANSFYIAKNLRNCWKCIKPTLVYAFILPTGHETVEYDEEAEVDLQRQWQAQDYPTIISYIDYLPTAIVKIMQELTPHYRLDFSQTTQSFYWMNHCEHCGMKQGDFELYDEPSGPFMPISEQEASDIQLSHFNNTFEAACGRFSIDINFFEAMSTHSQTKSPALSQFSNEIPWINASSIGAAKFCPQSVFLRKHNIHSQQDIHNMQKGKRAHRIASRDSRCFLATYIFSEQHWIVEALREWRDTRLKPYRLGRIFIKIYYYISPKLILWFGKSLLFRKFIQSMIIYFHSYFIKEKIK